MDIQNKSIIKFYPFKTPTFVLNLLLVVVLVLVYNKSLESKNLIVFYGYLFLLVYIIIKTFWMLISCETLYLSHRSIVYQINVLNICIRKTPISISDIKSMQYVEVEDGVRLKFLNLYTNNIWLSKYHSIIIKYNLSNQSRTKTIFTGPYDKNIKMKLVEYGF